MYLQSIEIDNMGPIENLRIDFPVICGEPKPVIIVGENGSGKSIFISNLVNSLILAKQNLYDDAEVEVGHVFKYRSPDYVKVGEVYSFSLVLFDGDVSVKEWQLTRKKSEIEGLFEPQRNGWGEIPDNEASFIKYNFTGKDANVRQLFEGQCCLYFPVDRFEEPAWLNIDNMNATASFGKRRNINRKSERSTICSSPMKENMNWMLDLIFDMQANDIVVDERILSIPFVSGLDRYKIFNGYSGQSTNIYKVILGVLNVVLRCDEGIRFGVGDRRNRKISIIKDKEIIVPNIFQLSTGETMLLNLFISIIRDYNYSGGILNSISDIRGIVIVDEIDAHLHTFHQYEILPNLIRYFPNVQFIITTHSPLFLMGMEKNFGSEGFHIYNMPTGSRVVAEDFSEFTAAYNSFKETTHHRGEIEKALRSQSKPIIYVEGDYDIRYLYKAADLLGKSDTIKKFEIKDGGGCGNLDKIWKNFDNPLSDALPNGLMLLYDCDTNKQDKGEMRIYKRVMPFMKDNPISIGIENLFPRTIIERAEGENFNYIDIIRGHNVRKRGIEELIPDKWAVNKDEKGNLCKWICENGDAEDFKNFSAIFKLMEDFLENISK